MTPSGGPISTDIGYAKINLALHVRRRRDDGYHELETLFAFVDAGDHLTCENAGRFELVHGNLPDQSGMGPDEANLVTRAARLAHGGDLPNVRITLDKRLPIAAGLGGGSADAAAALRLMGAGHRLDWATTLGADVPACMASLPVIGRGTGTDLEPVVNDVAGLYCLLVNPKVPLPTGPVFKAWNGADKGAMPQGSARAIMLGGRNDLEEPAIRLCPAIADVLAALRETRSLLTRMSGSGASCFAIYETHEAARHAQARLSALPHHNWWVMMGQLR